MQKKKSPKELELGGTESIIKWDLHLLQIWIKLIKLHFRPLENTKLNNPDENYAFSQKEKVNDIDKLYDKKFENLDLDESIDFLNNIITKANETQCDVTSAGFSAKRAANHLS